MSKVTKEDVCPNCREKLGYHTLEQAHRCAKLLRDYIGAMKHVEDRYGADADWLDGLASVRAKENAH